MIDSTEKRIFVDYSTLSTFLACREKCRLQNVMGWQKPDIKLDFGHAIHAGWAAYYDALAGGWHNEEGQWRSFHQAMTTGFVSDRIERIPINDPTARAQAAFLHDLGVRESTIPVSVDDDERRSLERGIALLSAYIERWKAEPYENILRDDGSPLVEVGFKFYLCQFGDYAVYVVGYIDRIMRNRTSGRPTIVEGKTTTQALSQFVQQSKPNHQVTIYFPAANAIAERLGLPKIRECLWDCMFISDRRPNYGKSIDSPYLAYGVDIQKDFARQSTTRSDSDVTAVLMDLEEVALDYCKYVTSEKTRWPRTAPGACHSYGGCRYRSRCSMNIDEVEEQSFMASEGFVVSKWRPWEKIVAREEQHGG